MRMLVHNICTLASSSSMHFRRPQINLATLVEYLRCLLSRGPKCQNASFACGKERLAGRRGGGGGGGRLVLARPLGGREG